MTASNELAQVASKGLAFGKNWEYHAAQERVDYMIVEHSIPTLKRMNVQLGLAQENPLLSPRYAQSYIKRFGPRNVLTTLNGDLARVLEKKGDEGVVFRNLFADYCGAMNSTHAPTFRTIDAFCASHTDQSVLFFNHDKKIRNDGGKALSSWHDIFEPIREEGKFKEIFEAFDRICPGNRPIDQYRALSRKLGAKKYASLSPFLMIYVADVIHKQNPDAPYSVELVDCFMQTAASHRGMFERTAIRLDKSKPFDIDAFYNSIADKFPQSTFDIFDSTSMFGMGAFKRSPVMETRIPEFVQENKSENVVTANEELAKIHSDIAEAYQGLAILNEQLANYYRK